MYKKIGGLGNVCQKAPFPWFGGKSRAASLIWDRFGTVANYVEPFFGSGAVLLGRPGEPGTETVNDLDCMVANFWRALAVNPAEVASAADWPVNEADLQARHTWLMGQVEFRERMKQDPDYHDAKIAGWWVWGQCSWIGGGWCAGPVYRKRPHLGNAGQGVHRGQQALLPYMEQLAERLRRVRVCCGDWARVLGPSVTFKRGMTAILLDPPYADTAGRDANIYSEESLTVAHDVRRWAIENGANPLLRIALCGYEGEHEMPAGWECVAWKAAGGYGSHGDGAGRENKHRERIWFSPACLRPGLFGGLDASD